MFPNHIMTKPAKFRKCVTKCAKIYFGKSSKCYVDNTVNQLFQSKLEHNIKSYPVC